MYVGGNSNHARLVAYTKQLASYVNSGGYGKALELFSRMRASTDLVVDPCIFPLALKAAAGIRNSSVINGIHAHVVKSGLLFNPFVVSALVDACGKAMSVASARKLFDEVPDRNDVVWNTMISHYAHADDVASALQLLEAMDAPPSASTYNSVIAALTETGGGGSSRALALYRRMQSYGIRPTLITVLSLLPICVGSGALDLAREIHGFGLRSGIHQHHQLASGLVEAYGRCGCLIYACRVFEGMIVRDAVAWTSMVSAYALNGNVDAAVSAFHQMDAAGVRPDRILFLTVLKACSHAGLADEALRYFGLMRGRYGLDAASEHYACLVDVLSRAGRLHEAFEIIKGMPMQPTVKAWGTLLGACRSYGDVELAEVAARALFEIEPENTANFVILANIYATAGKTEAAENVRREMEERYMRRTPGSSWVV